MYCSNWMLKGGVNRGCSSAIRKTHLRMSPRGVVFVKFHQRTREGRVCGALHQNASCLDTRTHNRLWGYRPTGPLSSGRYISRLGRLEGFSLSWQPE